MNRCDSCKNIPRCAICGSSSDSFRHVGVRGTANRLRIPIIDYTITQGLSEEMIELKTDMDPGTGWVIGNEEICDYCDANFVCNRIATGEYVNSWYDKSKNACWIGRK